MKCNCSSCDKEIDIDEADNFGRCQTCQDEYGEIEDPYDVYDDLRMGKFN